MENFLTKSIFLPQFKIMTPKKESVISTIFLHFAQ